VHTSSGAAVVVEGDEKSRSPTVARVSGMQTVAGHAARKTSGRYARGVKNLDPALVDRIRAALTADPSIAKAELARQIGVSRSTLSYYLRALPEQVQAVAARKEEVQNSLANSHLELLTKVSAAGEQIEQVIAELRTLPTTPATASAVFRGYAVLERYHRLSGELLGEIAPPTTNVYLMKVEAMLSAQVNPASLSPELRAALDEAQRNEQPH